MTCFERAISLSPNDPDLWCNKGVLLWMLQRDSNAHDCHMRALAIDPHHAQSCYNQGVGFLENGILDVAISWFDRALSIDPQLGDVWHNKGQALFRLNRFVEDKRCFEESRRLGNLLAEKGLRAYNLVEGMDHSRKLHAGNAE